MTKKDGEWDTVVNAVGESNIPRQDSSVKFGVTMIQRDGALKNTQTVIEFAKEKGKELRIYPASGDGFNFKVGDVGFVFRKKTKVFVGFMDDSAWKSFSRTDLKDDDFQHSIQFPDEPPAQYEVKGGKRFKRDPNVALEALKRARFRCEYDPKTKLFISRATGHRYVEAHHFIPVFATDVFGTTLDFKENIVSLCPHWHRAIHHGNDFLVRRILKKLASTSDRRAVLKKFDLSVDDLFEIYGV